MGTRNKERRRAKQRRQRGRDDSQRTGWSYSRTAAATETARRPDESWSAESIDTLLVAAAHAECEGLDACPLIAELVGATASLRFRDMVASRLSAALTNHASLCLHNGWEPFDLAKVLRRLAGATAAALVEGALPEAVQRQRLSTATEQRWQRQLEDMGGDPRVVRAASPTWETDLTDAVAALGALGHLPALPDLGPRRPAETVWPGTDPRILAKVRSLLAKAEATEFEEEAGAFLAKAQELMARHNLDRAAVEAGRNNAQTVEGRRCWLDDPYLKQKAYLVHVVAKANRCRSVADYELGMSTLFGTSDDLDTVEMLFTSLLVHATRQMALRATRPAKPSLGSSARRPAYRRSFLLAYADRIGARLCEASLAATKAAVQDQGDRLLPVLVSRGRLVDKAVQKAFPKVVSSEFSVTDYEGWAAGRAAADLADLAMRPKLAADAYR
jgi:hypothetical protein